MKIGLLFGSFNPIHTGHLIIANHIANFYTKQVWFVVSPQNPLKKQTELLEADKRLELTRLATKNNPSFLVSDTEFYLSTPSFTINTLRVFTEKHKHIRFFLIIGSDNFLNFSKWTSSDEILNKYNMLVYERPGFPLPNKYYHHNLQFIKSALINISSTEIRELITKNKSIRYLVPDNVRLAIEKNSYYK